MKLKIKHLVLIGLSCFIFQELYLNLGFYLKPYMVFSILVFPYCFDKSKRLILNVNELVLFCFLIYSTITIISNIQSELGLRYFLGIYFFIFSFISYKAFLQYHINDDMIDKICQIFIITSICYYLIGLYHLRELSFEKPISFGLYWDRGMPRIKGFFNNPDYINLFNWPILNYLIGKEVKSKITRLTILGSILIVILSFSITSIAIFLLIIIIKIFSTKKLVEKLFSFNYVFINTILLAFFFFLFQIPFFSEILELRKTHLETGSGRFWIWSEAINFFGMQNIFGSGIGAAADFARQFNFMNLHNTYLEIYIDTGYVGLLLFLAFLIFTIMKVENKKIILNLGALSLFLNLTTVSGLISESIIFMFLISQNFYTNKLLI